MGELSSLLLKVRLNRRNARFARVLSGWQETLASFVTWRLGEIQLRSSCDFRVKEYISRNDLQLYIQVKILFVVEWRTYPRAHREVVLEVKKVISKQ